MSASSTSSVAESRSSVAESRDQTTNFMFAQLRAQEVSNPAGYASDSLYEFFQNITIAGAGNRTHSEKRSSKSATEESIAFHFTEERVQILKNEIKNHWPAVITTESILRTHLQLRPRKLTETQNLKIKKINDDRRVAGKEELSEHEFVDVFNPKLADTELWARYKSLRAFAENVIGPAFKECMTKSTREIPSGRQLTDILHEILKKCWKHREEVRITHLLKSRAAAQAKAVAVNKAVDETKYRSSTGTNEMPDNWMPSEFGPWLLWGDLADARHPNLRDSN